MIKDTLQVKGELVVELRGADGELKELHEFKNLVVTKGKEFIAARMIGTTPAIMSHMGVGTSTAAAAVGQTDVQTPLGTRVAFDVVAVRNGAAVTYKATFPAGASTGAITEAGIFNAATAGDMLSRTTFPVINKQAADVLTINWTVTII